jgi:hypothetical protein
VQITEKAGAELLVPQGGQRAESAGLMGSEPSTMMFEALCRSCRRQQDRLQRFCWKQSRRRTVVN